jgi:hypothetical protein
MSAIGFGASRRPSLHTSPGPSERTLVPPREPRKKKEKVVVVNDDTFNSSGKSKEKDPNKDRQADQSHNSAAKYGDKYK